MLSSASYTFLRSTPLTALGISTAILGVISLALGRGQPKISPEATSILLESSLENVSAIIEELGLKSKAVYLPSSMTSGQPQALIPLHLNPNPPNPKTPLPKRLVVKYGPNPEDLGLLITTPGSTVISMLGSKPGSSPADIESALSSVVTGTMDLADSVKVTVSGERIVVEVSSPRLEHRDIWVYKCLGSPLASVAASATAEALGEPVIVDNEEYEKGKSIIELKVLRQEL
jgi:hypothetical protein